MGSKLNYEFFEHTADIGIIVEGKSLEELIENLVLVYSDLTTDFSKLKASINMKLKLPYEGIEDGIIKLIEEIIFLFETKKFLPKKCSVKIKENEIFCDLKGDIFDISKHPQKFIIKAITYHQFKIENQKNKWILRAVFDV